MPKKKSSYSSLVNRAQRSQLEKLGINPRGGPTKSKSPKNDSGRQRGPSKSPKTGR